jgi:type III restriction enzyme
LNTGKKIVKPFILVVCRDTTHAKEVYDLINSGDFYDGAYANKVLQIDSTTRNEELIEQQFITLEQEDNKIEIVIHVNMLKEGWDVSNLYTIVPLRAANASVLIEQTIGRGLRLPFNGERTGNEKVDKLTIVAHDKFNDVIKAAQDPNSILNKLKFIQIDQSELKERIEVVTVQNTLTENLKTEQEEVNKIEDKQVKQKRQNQVDAKSILISVLPTFNTNSAVKKLEDLNKPEVKAQVMKKVEFQLNSGQGNLFAESIVEEAGVLYETLVRDLKDNIIEIPRMDLMQGEVTASFEDFDLESDGFSYSQLNDEIVRIGLVDKSYDTIDVITGVNFGSPVKLLVSELINYSEIDYDANPDLLHKLARQAVSELESNLKEAEDIKVLVFQYRRIIAERIYKQMMDHFYLEEPEYVKPIVRPFTKIENWNFTALENEGRKDYGSDSFPASQIRKFLFCGFRKSCHFEYKFDSRPEQIFSFILENDKEIMRWLRPAPQQFRIYWSHNNNLYEPDFIAETNDCIYMIEIKAANKMNDADVLEKAKAAIKYCNYATEYTSENGGKPWKYVLIPDDKVAKNGSFKGSVLPYTVKSE